MIADVEFNDVKFKMCIPEKHLHSEYHGGNVQSAISNNKVWALDESLIMHKILNQQKGLVVDIGANTGYFSFIGLINECKVIAIEANPIHTPYVNKTMEINNFPTSNFQHMELFVSSKKEDCIFDGWSGNVNLMSKKNKISMVKTIALTDICSECLFLKIDVEGNEPDVLESAIQLLEREKIKYIMFEITYIMSNAIDTKNVEMLALLKYFGFELYEIQERSLIKITNIKQKINKWNYEYFNNHKKANPSITSAGSNLLAIHKNAVNIFKQIPNTNNYYID
jgi:FkbM family methyltransferase